MNKVLFLLCLATLAMAAQAQGWPAKTVRIIVPFPAGGSADLLPRIVAEKLSEKWGQPVIVENRPGAAGNIGADIVFRSEPDGYTLLSAPPPPLVINRLLYPKLSYDSTQFVPVTVIAANPNVLLVHPSLGVNSVAELIALARQNPGKLNYASQGSGSTSHLTAELFKSMAGGLQITHVPYKGSAPALTDLLAGQVDMMCDNLGVSLPHVRSGKLKALAVASKQRFAGLPDVPVLAETLPGFESLAWYGIVAPPRTPAPIAAKVSAGVADALKNPDVGKRLQELSAEPMGLSPAQTGAFMRQEAERWGAIIRSAGVKVD
jgi:tripartite-type tricarboxylate transporter receptor subunit TctC